MSEKLNLIKIFSFCLLISFQASKEFVDCQASKREIMITFEEISINQFQAYIFIIISPIALIFTGFTFISLVKHKEMNKPPGDILILIVLAIFFYNIRIICWRITIFYFF